MQNLNYGKRITFITFLLVVSASRLFSQPNDIEAHWSHYLKPFDSPRGHYKSLQTYSRDSRPEDKALDDHRYPVTAEDIERGKRRVTHYLETNEPIIIPDFPANSSEQTRKELDYLLQLQEQRFKEDMDLCLYMASVWFNHSVKPEDKRYPQMRRNLFFIGRSIGTWFNADSLPATAQLVANVWRDASFYIWKYKNEFARARPYVLEPKLKNLEVTNWPAYPSGHAANSYVNAYLFSELAPEFSDVFLKDALDMAHSRERIGVHYPSDSEASRMLARQLVNKLFEKEQFRKDFEKAAAEWEVVRARNF